MYLSLRIRSRDHNAIIDVTGDIDINSGPWLRECLLRLPRADRTRLLLDLSGVTFIDCAGLRMLLEACDDAGTREGTMRITAPSRHVLRLAELTGLREALLLALPRRPRSRPAHPAPLRLVKSSHIWQPEVPHH